MVCVYLLQQPSVCAQNKVRITPAQYISTFDQDAVREMLKSGVPASITLAQGMLESDNGNSDLAINARNHFGIKCHSTWTGKRYHKDDDAKGECFRVYVSAYESYLDHSDFLKRNKRYEFLFSLERTDYKAWAYGLKKAGYATNPKYPELLIKIIEENSLHRFDKMMAADLPTLGGKAEDFEKQKLPDKTTASNSNNGAIMVSDNQIKYVFAQQGDHVDELAKRYRMGRWQIYCYNEIKRGHTFAANDVVYLQPKRRKYKGQSTTHTVKSGETLWHISHKYGIKQRHLARLNHLGKNDAVNPGTTLQLR